MADDGDDNNNDDDGDNNWNFSCNLFRMMIVRIIGILNSGIGYAPINSRYPIERQQYILSQTSPSCYLNSFSFSSSHDLIRIPMVSEGKIQQLLLIAIE